jgi:ABC-type antimicrobial peptide transport system permease subunit
MFIIESIFYTILSCIVIFGTGDIISLVITKKTIMENLKWLLK